MNQNENAHIEIEPYRPVDRSAIRDILEAIGWDEHYIAAFEQTAESFAQRDAVL